VSEDELEALCAEFREVMNELRTARQDLRLFGPGGGRSQSREVLDRRANDCSRRLERTAVRTLLRVAGCSSVLDAMTVSTRSGCSAIATNSAASCGARPRSSTFEPSKVLRSPPFGAISPAARAAAETLQCCKLSRGRPVASSPAARAAVISSPSCSSKGSSSRCGVGSRAGSVDVVVFDPPYKLNGTSTGLGPSAADARYGVSGAYASVAERHALILDGVAEATRVARRRVLVKVQDQVCSGRVWWQTRLVADHGESLGCRLVDQLHVPGHRPQPGGRRQVHARRNYSTLLVLEVAG